MEFSIYTISVKGLFSKYYEIHQDDHLVYRVKKPSLFAFGERVFTRPGGAEVLKIKRDVSLFILKFKFTVTEGEDHIATIEKDNLDNFYNSSSIYGHFTVQGNFFNNEYTIFHNSEEIAKISRKRFRSAKKYGIAIIEGFDELYILSLVIAISIVNANRKKRA